MAVGALAGIGFTMSIFIAGLALSGPTLDAAKIGILAGSVVSGALGVGLLLALLPKPEKLSHSTLKPRRSRASPRPGGAYRPVRGSPDDA